MNPVQVAKAIKKGVKAADEELNSLASYLTTNKNVNAVKAKMYNDTRNKRRADLKEILNTPYGKGKK